MRTQDCPSCRTTVDAVDRFCRSCGLALAAAPSAAASSAASATTSQDVRQTRVNGERAVTVREAEVLPAVRSDLRALQPAVVRTVGVLAAAGFLEWAVRRGTRELLADGLGLGRRPKPQASAHRVNGRAEIETLVIQRRVSLKQ